MLSRILLNVFRTYIIKTEIEKLLTVVNWRKLMLIEISLTLEINSFNLFLQLYSKNSLKNAPSQLSLKAHVNNTTNIISVSSIILKAKVNKRWSFEKEYLHITMRFLTSIFMYPH